MVERITLYTGNYSPFPHRVQIALEEAGADYNLQWVDFSKGKPEWYVSKVNPAGLVPAIAYGGPNVPTDQPSPESIKIAESLVLLEFVADLFPSSGLLPSDPVQRARVRFFIDTVANKFVPAMFGFIGSAVSADDLYKAIDAFLSLLPDEKKYVLGDAFTLADISIAPFLIRMEMILSGDYGAYPVGEGVKLYNTLQSSQKYKRYREYMATLKERESVMKTFDIDGNMKTVIQRFGRS